MQIEQQSDGHWEYVLRLDARPAQPETGKYLFFSPDRERLFRIARTEIRDHGFFVAKVSCTPDTGVYVLCLYWHDDSRRHELAGRNIRKYNVKYRWWKSNEQTARDAAERYTGGPVPLRGAPWCGYPAHWGDLDDPDHPDPHAAAEYDNGLWDALLMDKDWF